MQYPGWNPETKIKGIFKKYGLLLIKNKSIIVSILLYYCKKVIIGKTECGYRATLLPSQFVYIAETVLKIVCLEKAN